ncbi:MAG: sulfite exporter TauE/SafE family protein [Candidatus Thorarchaeota archaeon]
MEFSFIVILLLILLGFLSGTIAVIAGVGGGVFFVSTLTLLLFIPIDIAIDTSTFIILMSSLAGFITYLRQKRTQIKLTLLFTIFSILGSIIASILFLFIHVNNYILKVVFASALLVAGLNMVYKAVKTTNNRKNHNENDIVFSLNDHDYNTNLKKSIPLFILAGFVANFLGLGGGIIFTPALNIILHYPIHNATAISTSMIFFTAIYNTIMKSILGQIDYVIGIFVAIGSICGSIFGAKISNRMPKIYLQFFVAIVLMGLAIRMYF